MRSKDQLAVIAHLEENRTATPRRLTKVLGWESKHTHNILGRLLRIGVIKNVGAPGRTEYRLVQRWQQKVKQARPAAAKPQHMPVTQVCRENWQGYHVHKIFGSARA